MAAALEPRSVACFLLLILWPAGARMSGEAAVSYVSEWYQLIYSSGVRVSYAPEPQPDGAEIDRSGEHFASDQNRLRVKLAPRVERVTAIVDAYRRAGRIALAPMGTPAISLQRAVLDAGDGGASSKYAAQLRRWRAADAQRPGLLVEVDGSLKSLERARLGLILTAPVEQQVVDAMMAEIVAALESPIESSYEASTAVLMDAPPITTTTRWLRLRFSLNAGLWERSAASELAARAEVQAAAYGALFNRVVEQAARGGLPVVVLGTPDAAPVTIERGFYDGHARVELWAASEAEVPAVAEGLRTKMHEALSDLHDERYTGLP